MFKTQGYHTLELRWKAQKRETIKDSLSRITYERIKSKEEDLEQFFIEEKEKGAQIYLDYIIDGTDLAFWINLNIYRYRAIGLDYSNRLSQGINFSKHVKEMSATWGREMLKQMLGQKITYEECLENVKEWLNSKDQEEIESRARSIFEGENKDVMLFASACCADRLCGYIGAQIHQSETGVLWHLPLLRRGPVAFNFKKEAYFNAFKEFGEFINKRLREEGKLEVDLYKNEVTFLSKEERIHALKTKYNLEPQTYQLKDLKQLFSQGDIHEIDAGITWAMQLGLNLKLLREEMEAEYKALSKEEKNSISWKIADANAYLESVDLTDRGFAVKAYLLYSNLNNAV